MKMGIVDEGISKYRNNYVHPSEQNLRAIDAVVIHNPKR
jgi:hypothetical protein